MVGVIGETGGRGGEDDPAGTCDCGWVLEAFCGEGPALVSMVRPGMPKGFLLRCGESVASDKDVNVIRDA